MGHGSRWMLVLLVGMAAASCGGDSTSSVGNDDTLLPDPESKTDDAVPRLPGGHYELVSPDDDGAVASLDLKPQELNGFDGTFTVVKLVRHSQILVLDAPAKGIYSLHRGSGDRRVIRLWQRSSLIGGFDYKYDPKAKVAHFVSDSIASELALTVLGPRTAAQKVGIASLEGAYDRGELDLATLSPLDPAALPPRAARQFDRWDRVWGVANPPAAYDVVFESIHFILVVESAANRLELDVFDAEGNSMVNGTLENGADGGVTWTG